MATDYLEQSLTKLKEFEGCVSWMYLDTVGRVTVGVGLMLPDAKAAQALPFLIGARTATPQEIAAEFARILALPPGHPAIFYKPSNAMELAAATIDSRLTAVLEIFESNLRNHFPRYDSFPSCVKLALLDMIYNLGPKGLFEGFPHLVAAIEAGAWSEAAGCCLRRGPGPIRNNWTRQQFLAGVVGSIQAQAESWLTRVLGRLRLIVNRLFLSFR